MLPRWITALYLAYLAVPIVLLFTGSFGDLWLNTLLPTGATTKWYVQVASDADAGIVVTPSAHKKCERCWHYRDDVGHDAAHPELCGRCTSNLHGAGEARSVA